MSGHGAATGEKRRGGGGGGSCLILGRQPMLVVSSDGRESNETEITWAHCRWTYTREGRVPQGLSGQPVAATWEVRPPWIPGAFDRWIRGNPPTSVQTALILRTWVSSVRQLRATCTRYKSSSKWYPHWVWLLAHPCLRCRTPLPPLSPGTLHPHLAPCTRTSHLVPTDKGGTSLTPSSAVKRPTPSPERYLSHSLSVLPLPPYPFAGQSSCAPSSLFATRKPLPLSSGQVRQEIDVLQPPIGSPHPPLSFNGGGVQKGQGARPC